MEDCVGVIINGRKLIVNKLGEMWAFERYTNKIYLYPNKPDVNNYNIISCKSKPYYRHRILAYTFLNLDLNDKNQVVDHIDMQRLNNSITNLRVITPQQNQWNKTSTKGYTWNSKEKKWRSSIKFNNKTISLGQYKTEDEARNAYLEAKKIYHKFI